MYSICLFHSKIKPGLRITLFINLLFKSDSPGLKRSYLGIQSNNTLVSLIRLLIIHAGFYLIGQESITTSQIRLSQATLGVEDVFHRRSVLCALQAASANPCAYLLVMDLRMRSMVSASTFSEYARDKATVIVGRGASISATRPCAKIQLSAMV